MKENGLTHHIHESKIFQFDVAFVCKYLHFTQNVPSMFDISRASIKTNNSLSIWKILFTMPFQAQLFILASSYLISYRYISVVCVILFANAFRYDFKSHFKNKFVLTIFKDFCCCYFSSRIVNIKVTLLLWQQFWDFSIQQSDCLHFACHWKHKISRITSKDMRTFRENEYFVLLKVSCYFSNVSFHDKICYSYEYHCMLTWEHGKNVPSPRRSRCYTQQNMQRQPQTKIFLHLSVYSELKAFLSWLVNGGGSEGGGTGVGALFKYRLLACHFLHGCFIH